MISARPPRRIQAVLNSRKNKNDFTAEIAEGAEGNEQ